MTPTLDLREELRELLDEEIPLGGTEADTGFTDAQIKRLLEAAISIYAAAAEGWRRKAGKIQKQLGHYSSYQAGTEKYEYVNLTTAMSAALNMVKIYDDMAARPFQGSYMFSVKPPEVL